MRFPIANFQFPISRSAGDLPRCPIGNRQSAIGNAAAFTLMEIAICLAIIGFALVAIIGVLPIGMNAQQASREGTVINQDATVFLSAIRGGAQGLDYLTNYVYAISNNVPGNPFSFGYDTNFLTSGARIIGLLSTPEYLDSNSNPIPSMIFGGYSNHVVAYVRSLSGLAAEKPPQDNQILREDTFSYRIYCVNAPMPVDTNLFNLYDGGWLPQPYTKDQEVFSTYNWNYWRAVADTVATDVPGQSSLWTQAPNYSLSLAANQRELRLTFLWPQLPNGKVGNGRLTYRATIAGQLTKTNESSGQVLYFYQPQIFTNAP